jgi:hypothetical protein
MLLLSIVFEGISKKKNSAARSEQMRLILTPSLQGGIFISENSTVNTAIIQSSLSLLSLSRYPTDRSYDFNMSSVLSRSR